MTAGGSGFTTLPSTANVIRWHYRCLQCTYDLYGQPLDGVCPECGNRIPNVAPRPPSQVRAAPFTPLPGEATLTIAAAIGGTGTFCLAYGTLAYVKVTPAIPSTDFYFGTAAALLLFAQLGLTIAGWQLSTRPRWLLRAPRMKYRTRAAIILQIASFLWLFYDVGSRSVFAPPPGVAAMVFISAPYVMTMIVTWMTVRIAARYLIRAGEPAGAFWFHIAAPLLSIASAYTIYAITAPLIFSAPPCPPEGLLWALHVSAAGTLLAGFGIILCLGRRLRRAIWHVIRESLRELRRGSGELTED